MLDHSYSASDMPVAVQPGPVIGLVTAAEAWAAAVTARNACTAQCGATWLLLAQERPPAGPGHWQVVYDHVETWSEALAIWRVLAGSPHIQVVRARPSGKLAGLPGMILKAAKRAMAREGWALETGADWIIRREVRDGQ